MARFNQTKYCPGCQETKDRREFHRNISQLDGLHTTCKVCRAARVAELKAFRKARGEKPKPVPSDAPERKREKKARLLEQVKQSAVEQVVHDVAKTGGYVPHTEDLLEKVIALMGGADILAEKLVEHIEACPAGSQQQGKALDMMMRYLDKHTQRQVDQSTPIEQADEEDLRRRLDEAIARNQLKLHPKEEDGREIA